MNIIREQRADVIQTRNAAQSRLRYILETQNKASTQLILKEPLAGDLDFSILPEFGMSNVTEIRIGSGEITNIIGLPTSLQTFFCEFNLLTELENLPPKLRVLEIPHNYLVSIDVSKLGQLETLNLSDNKITELKNLPGSITELACDGNELAKLDLQNVPNLKKLNISNNKITLVENMPEGIFEFKMENTPTIEFRASSVGEVLATTMKTNEDADAATQSRTYDDSLREYFRLKTKYENKVYAARKKVFERAPNKRTGKLAVAAVKPQCIKCGRPVGSLFFREKNRYVASCGDTQAPCSLNIQLFAGRILPLSYMLYLFKEDTEDMKDTIIRQKLDTLFNYISEDRSVELFKKELEAYTQNSKEFKALLDLYTDLYESEHKREQINKKNGEIFVLNEKIQALLAEYEKTENREVLMTAMVMQVKELGPEVRNLRILENEVTEVGVGDKEGEYRLCQYPIALSKLDYSFGEPPRIIKFSV